MRVNDIASLSLKTVGSHKLRSALTALGIIIGIASVVILTAVGEGIHRFVLAEFTQFGTNLVAVTPGKTTTFGLSGATISTVRPLSLADAVSLEKLENVIDVVALVQGNARVEGADKQRRASVFGVGAAVPAVWKIKVDIGRFLPKGEQRNPRSLAVLGSKLRAELFPSDNPLGQRIRIGADRFRVIGVMAPRGESLGWNFDDLVMVPVATCMRIFDRSSLFRILTRARHHTEVLLASEEIRDLITARHNGEEAGGMTRRSKR